MPHRARLLVDLIKGVPGGDALLAVPVECLDLYDDGAFDDCVVALSGEPVSLTLAR
jgi:hypothetical protein